MYTTIDVYAYAHYWYAELIQNIFFNWDKLFNLYKLNIFTFWSSVTYWATIKEFRTVKLSAVVPICVYIRSTSMAHCKSFSESFSRIKKKENGICSKNKQIIPGKCKVVLLNNVQIIYYLLGPASPLPLYAVTVNSIIHL